MKTAIALLFLCLPCFAQSTRVRCEHMEGDKIVAFWGTATCFGGKWVTCAHNVKGAESILLESRGSWIRCDVKKKDSKVDIALLNPDLNIDVPDERKHGTFCHGSSEGKQVKSLDAKVVSSEPLGDHVEVKGMAHGLSGSAITVDGETVGIITGFAGVATKGETKRFKDCAFLSRLSGLRSF